MQNSVKRVQQIWDILLQDPWLATFVGIILIWMYFPQENVGDGLGFEIGTYTVICQIMHRVS